MDDKAVTVKCVFHIPDVYSVFSVIKVLTNIEAWPLWDPDIREAELLQKYSSNLGCYLYVREHVPGSLYQFAEKQIVFSEEDEVYVYGSEVPGSAKRIPGVEKGKIIADVKKIYVEDKYVVIEWVRQTNEEKLDDDTYSVKYLEFKDSLLKKLAGRTTNM